MTYIWAKTDIKHEENERKYVIVLHFDNFQQLASIEHNWIPECQKDIEICYSPWQNLHHMSLSFWYSDVLYTSQELEAVRNRKNSIV